MIGDVMKKPELLAPAGNMECLRAAVLAGCDAVYLGGYTFGARSYATNFSNEEIIEAVNYCHLRKVKVYVTVNTLIYEDKFDMCISYVDFLHRNNVDALIVQDLGLADYIRKVYPNMEIHASTQMHIHNKEGVLFARDFGFKRAVIARETSIDDIREIKKINDIELEVFVHGALCVCYSGQCLMSSMIGGRSGNLGTCSQCCRMKYNFYSDGIKKNKNEYLLSTKDLNTIEHIGELIDAGIDSLKIEGRMKRKEYVYTVVSIYRKAIDNYLLYHDSRVTKSDLDALELIFNRKFTKGFLFNESITKFTNSFRPNHMGVELGKVVDIKDKYIFIKLSRDLSVLDGIRILGDKDDVGFTIQKMFIGCKEVLEAKSGDIVKIPCENKVAISSEVVKTTDIKQLNFVKEKLNDEKKFKITGEVFIEISKPIRFVVHDGSDTVEAISTDVALEALNQPISRDRIKEQLSKFGGTIYEMDKLDINMNCDNVFIPIVVLNELRRNITSKLNSKRLYQIPYEKREYKISVSNYSHEENMSILISTKSEYNEVENKNYQTIYTENPDLCEVIPSSKLVFRLPRVNNYYYEYNMPLLVGEIGSLYKYRENRLTTDFSFNVVNSYTLAFLHSINVDKVTLSYELTKEQIKDIIDSYFKRYNVHPNVEVIISSYPEVMISKFNLPAYFGCREGDNYLKDSYSNSFRVISNDNYMRIYHYRLIEDDDTVSYFKMGVNSLRIHRSL